MKYRLRIICVNPCFIRGSFFGFLYFITVSSLAAQELAPLATAAAMERLMTEAIERAEKSVVAIARVRKEDPGTEPTGTAAGSFAGSLIERASPADPRFVPTEFGSGVVIDPSGLVVTNYHVLGNVRQAE